MIVLGIVTFALQAPGGAATLDAERARAWVEGASRVWKNCGISLVHREHRVLRTTETGLPLSPENLGDLTNSIRASRVAPGDLSVTVTAAWNRSGELGTDTSWAYGFPARRMPVSGVIAESRAVERPTLLAHEIGHLLELPHTVTDSDRSGLMLRSVYEDNQALSPAQCAQARQAACRDRACPTLLGSRQ